MPTDLLGITPALYESARQDKNLRAALGPVASKITRAISKIGSLKTTASSTSATEPEQNPNYTDTDKLAILQSWMGARPAELNTQVIHFRQVDLELKLDRGTTKKLIKQAASHWRYVVEHEGEETILFSEEPSHYNIEHNRGWSSF